MNDFVQYVSLKLAAGAKDACAEDRYVSVETGISTFDVALRSQTPKLSLTPKAKGIKNKAAIVNESMGRTVPRCRAVQLGQFHKVYGSGLLTNAQLEVWHHDYFFACFCLILENTFTEHHTVGGPMPQPGVKDATGDRGCI